MYLELSSPDQLPEEQGAASSHSDQTTRSWPGSGAPQQTTKFLKPTSPGLDWDSNPRRRIAGPSTDALARWGSAAGRGSAVGRWSALRLMSEVAASMTRLKKKSLLQRTSRLGTTSNGPLTTRPRQLMTFYYKRKFVTKTFHPQTTRTL